MVAQVCKYAKIQWTSYFKLFDFMLHKLYLNNAVKKKNNPPKKEEKCYIKT